MLSGRLGLETARIPHADRHGLCWLERGRLFVTSGTLRFRAAASRRLAAGDYELPFQLISCVLAGPGTTLTHDALRLLARHGTALIMVGEDGTRFYASLPAGPDQSKLARRQVELWSRPDTRIDVARRMYGIRMGELLAQRDIAALRGIEGARVKEVYRCTAERFGIDWKGRRYDRSNPGAADVPNQAINHAASAAEAAAMIAVAATGTIPQLGFIHEDSGHAFTLDVADLIRDDVTVPVAFSAARRVLAGESDDLERAVRRLAGWTFRKEGVIPRLIDLVKQALR